MINPANLSQAIDGILLLDKPKVLGSNDALQRAKRLFKAKKAGHTGSLDPLATGMLPICFGEATKFSQFLLEADKVYEVVAQLGMRTTTGDAEGKVLAEKPVPEISHDDISKLFKRFEGEIEQIPPMFSALKHQGKPLYTLARKGIQVERKPRKITIFSLDFLYYEKNHLAFRVHCSKGTYVRTLVEDLGEALGCGAYVAELRRNIVKPFIGQTMYDFATLEEFLKDHPEKALNTLLLPIDAALTHLPITPLSTGAAYYLKTGQAVRVSSPIQSGLVQLKTENGTFLGIGEVLPDGRIKPHRLCSLDGGCASIKATPSLLAAHQFATRLWFRYVGINEN